MKLVKSFRKRFVIFLAICTAVMALSYIRTFTLLPGKVTLLEGDEYVWDIRSPFLVTIKADTDGIVKLNNRDIKASTGYIKLSDPITFQSQKRGSVSIHLRVFGFIPLKTMKLDIVPNKKLVACGNTVGVRLKLNGILVLALTDVQMRDGKRSLPARESGLKPGDLIMEVNNTRMDSIDELVEQIESSKGKAITIRYKRGNVFYTVDVKPVLDVDDKSYHIGLWVRDSTAGIGTLTFYNPETMEFGALGHGITDIDTGTLMPVDKGEILESNIIGIRKGKQGNPGELKGVFMEDRGSMGRITLNSSTGIFGVFDKAAAGRINGKAYPIALRGQVKEGPAMILANVDGKTVTDYSVELEKVSRQGTIGSKGMVIKITDKRLLDSTGGIVQGMSGSPIIQNGRIIGAVTHVLVNDPTRGYGIFIEGMLKNLSTNSSTMEKKAG